MFQRKWLLEVIGDEIQKPNQSNPQSTNKTQTKSISKFQRKWLLEVIGDEIQKPNQSKTKPIPSLTKP